MIIKSRPAKTIECTDELGNVYLLVSDGPDTSTGRVLRQVNAVDWVVIPYPDDGPILMDYIAHCLLEAEKNAK
jgi:hypothetical protein